jgi:hypothetical protein
MKYLGFDPSAHFVLVDSFPKKDCHRVYEYTADND